MEENVEKKRKSSKIKKKTSGNEKGWDRENHFKKRTPWITQGTRISSINHFKKLFYEEGSKYCHFTFTYGIVLQGCNHFESKNWRGYVWCCLHWSHKYT